MVWFELFEMLVVYYGLIDFKLCLVIEEGLCMGMLCCVVVILSLDLGVDFFIVDWVI